MLGFQCRCDNEAAVVEEREDIPSEVGNARQVLREEREDIPPDMEGFRQLLREELREQEIRIRVMLEQRLRQETLSDTSPPAEETQIYHVVVKEPKPLGNHDSKQDRLETMLRADTEAEAEPPHEQSDKERMEALRRKMSGLTEVIQPEEDDTKDNIRATTEKTIIPKTTSQQSQKSEEDVYRGRLLYWWQIFGQEQPLDMTNPLNKLVMSKAISHLSTFIVVLNAAQLGYTSEYALKHPDKPRNVFIDVTDVSFCLYYLIEVVLRLCAFKARFFCNNEWKWNWFDAFLVAFSLYEESSKFATDGSGGGNLANIMRVIKVVKTVKMLRFVHAMHFFRELRHFLVPITKSLRALFWTLLMLGMILYIFAVVFLQGVAEAIIAHDVESSKEDLLTYFGSVVDAMTSLYMAITGGDDWSKYAVLLKDVGLHYYYFFFFYIAFLTFAVLNILTGIFVDSAMQYSNEDRTSSATQLEADAELKNAVLKEFQKMHEDDVGDQSLTKEVFQELLHAETMIDFLNRLDISKIDAVALLRRLTTSMTDPVKLETFLDCAVWMKGPARSVHLHEMMAESTAGKSEIMDALKALENKIGTLHYQC